MRAFLHTYGAAILTGIVLFLAFPSTNWHPLAWIALIPLLLKVHSLTPSMTAKLFFISGWIFHSLLLQWLITNVYWAGGWAIWGYQGICMYMALSWALLGFSWKYLSQRLPRLVALVLIVLLWGSMEFLQSIAFTGFGWGALAHSQSYNVWAFQLASLGGYVLIGLSIVSVNVLLAESIVCKSKRWILLGGAIAVLGIVHGAGYILLKPTVYSETPMQIALYQPNTPIDTKWDPEFMQPLFEQAVYKSRILANESSVDLFIWPEALIVNGIDNPSKQQDIQSLLIDKEAELFVGAQRRDDQQFYNSSFLLRPNGDTSEYYDKIHLAPFGEYVPFADMIPALRNFVPSMSDQSPGSSQKVFDTQGRRMGPLICFEVLFSPMSQQLRIEGADFLAVVTNMAWFGSSNSVPQELAIAKLRAVETRLPLVQAANTGYSGIIDPWGRYNPVNRYIDASGSMYRLSELKPEETSFRRLGGVLPLPEAALQPIPNGPLFFPYFVLSINIAFVGFALKHSYRKNHSDTGSKL